MSPSREQWEKLLNVTSDGEVDVDGKAWDGEIDYAAWERREIDKVKKGIALAIAYNGPKREATYDDIQRLVKHGRNVIRFALREMVEEGKVIASIDRHWGHKTLYRLSQPEVGE